MQETTRTRPKTVTKQQKSQNSKKSKRKARKRIKRCLILIFIIIAISIFALITPIFNITQIKVEGNKKIETESIISLSGLNIGENIFRNQKSKITNNIQENSYIKKATMKRNLPGTIELIIEERTVEYQIKLIDGYIYIDNQGYILENVAEKAEVPILEGLSTSQEELLNGKRLNVEDLNRLNTILKITEGVKTINIENLITTINVEDVNEYILYLKKEKKYIYLGDASNLSNKMLYIETMLKQEKGNSGKMFINGNLSNGFKPYFREEKIESKNP